MYMISLALAGLCSLASAELVYTKAADEFLVKDLPGAPPVSFRHYSGLLPVTSDGSRKIHFWYIEAESNPETAPLVLWTNGGPGCSGLAGALTEQGPFRPEENGTLSLNKFAWTKVANMVFIEQPAGVGFSTAPKSYTNYSDDSSATDNHAFIKEFFATFPGVKNSPFYISSESYGGHYMPTLAKVITDSKDIANFKGFLVGNPYTWDTYTDLGQYMAFQGHGLVPAPSWNKFVAAGCLNATTFQGEGCQLIAGDIDSYVTGVDPYALDFPPCPNGGPLKAFEVETGRMKRFLRNQKKQRTNKFVATGKEISPDYFPPHYEQCAELYMTKYLNRADVKKAFHVSPDIDWGICADIPWHTDGHQSPMMPLYPELKKTGIKMLVFSGDDDSVCPTPDTQLWIWDLGFSIKDGWLWKPWFFESVVAGFVTKFEGLDFYTVHGAGHMVPSTRPGQALSLFKEFLGLNNTESN